MITIDQLLESVDLDFEPRFVTKDQNGMVWLWEKKPHTVENWWNNTLSIKDIGGKIKLSEFDGKDWTECIYEVPRKVDYTKWAGRVCRFWNADNPKLFKNIGVLVGINHGEKRPFQCASKPCKFFEHCEPVRPDDDVIYKGE